MKIIYLTSLALTALTVPFGAGAQRLPETETDATLKVVQSKDTTQYFLTLHENAPHIANLADVPRFAVFGKEGKFYLGLGMNIKMVGEYDAGNPVPDRNIFATSAIPMHIAPGNGGEFNFSAQQSNIYLNVVALPGSKHQIGAYFSMNFRGDNYAPKLQHAYLKYRDFTAGYTYPIFSDHTISPATIDYEGPNCLQTIPHGMVAYEPHFGTHRQWQAGVGLDVPENSCTNAPGTATVSQRLPDISAYLQRSWAGGAGHFRIAGMMRNIYYRNTGENRNIDRLCWGVKASGITPIVGGLSASFSGVYGNGIASYIQDLNGMGMDLMPDGDNPGHLKAVKAWGAFGSFTYRFNPKLFCSATYSHVRTYQNRYSFTNTPWGETYRYAQYVAANVFYNINSIVQLGAEYLYGRRVNCDGAQAHDSRIEAMIQVSF